MIKEKVEKWVLKKSISIAIKFTIGTVVIASLFLFLLFKSNAGDDTYIKMYNEMGEVQSSTELNRNLKKQVEFVSKSTLNNTDSSGKMIPGKASSASVDLGSYSTYTSSDNSAEINQLLSVAESKIGCPYIFGALRVTDGGPPLFDEKLSGKLTSKGLNTIDGNAFSGYYGREAFDCSSYTQYCYNQIGISIGGDTYSQINNGTPVARKDLKPGDLVLPDAGHVAIYVGNDQMIHAPHSGLSVKVGPVYGFYAGRRIVP